MIEKNEVSSLGKLFSEDPDSIVIIVCFFIISVLFCKSSYKFWKVNKTHVERSTPYSVHLFEEISCIFASALLTYLIILTRSNTIVVNITAAYCSLVITFSAWGFVGIFAYLDYRNNKPNLEHQKMRDELDEELCIIEEERKSLDLKTPNNDELKNFHNMVDKYNAKVTIFNANREQFK